MAFLNLPHPATTVAALAALLAACSPATGEAAGGVRVSGAWVRTPSPGAPTAAGYAVLTNAGAKDDRLIGASSPAAQSVMAHRSFQEGSVMRMEHIHDLPVPAGKSVTLAPGGYHLMLVGLKAPVPAGTRLPVTLRFERAGAVKADFVVGPAPP